MQIQKCTMADVSKLAVLNKYSTVFTAISHR